MASLAVQDVHYRDIIEEMANAGVESINDFKWQMQLRLYFEDDNIYAKQVNA
jgi:dynein heavy chain